MFSSIAHVLCMVEMQRQEKAGGWERRHFLKHLELTILESASPRTFTLA